MVRHAPELQCKSMYGTRHEWIAIQLILHSVVGPRTGSVSCCCPDVLLLAVILLLYCRIHSYTAWLRTINAYCCIVYLHLICSFVRSDDLLNTNYDRSGIGAEKPILIPSIFMHIPKNNTKGNEA